MRYSTIVEQDDKTLVEIIDALNQFEKDRFIAGIQARNFSSYEIEQASDLVHMYQAKMNIESRALVKFSETFIQQFATDNNKCFETAQLYFHRIRSTLAALKNVLQKTTPRSMVQLPEGVTQPTVFQRSALTYGAVQRDMFGLASYDEKVQQLFHQFDTLLSTATTTLGLCHQMIENEKIVREDAEQLRLIYKDSCNALMDSVREYAELVGDIKQVSETELNKRKAKARSMDDFLRSEYHNVPKKEFKRYVLLEVVKQGRNEGLTEEETFLFHDNHEKVKLVRYAIEHFDKMEVEGQQGKLDSTSIVYFLKWCGVDKAKEKRLYTYFCDTYKGRFRTLVWSAVSKERKELVEVSHITDEQMAVKFQLMLDTLPQEVEVA